MLCTLHGQKGVTLDLPATVSWSSSNGQQFGEATLTIIRDSAAWSADIASEQGGFLVTITTRFGVWKGVADTPEFTTSGMTVIAQHVNVWAQLRTVAPYRVFHGVCAGTIVRRAVLDALVGLGSVPVTIGPIVCAPPVIAEFVFQQQTLLAVLTELSQRTGQQWTINDRFQFTWRNQIGRYREFALIDDGKMLSSLQRRPLADQVAESIEIEPGGRTFTARDGSVPALWPSQEIVRI